MNDRRGRFAVIVLDGVGIGAAPDADQYGDVGSNTLGNLAEVVGALQLPNLERLGLGCCRPVAGLTCASPTAAHGVALPASIGKDSTTGHWEMCGVLLGEPFPTYPRGFPHAVIAAFVRKTGRDVLANRAGSGTVMIEEFGREHLERGDWIVYTSADSVFQVAAHESTVSLEELYGACTIARREILVGEHTVSRVIARPFVGEPGTFQRTGNRKDFSVVPPGVTLLDTLAAAGIPRVGVGKVDDLFAGRNITSYHTPSNAEAYERIADALETMVSGFLFANVIEFDQSWGHRNDVEGFRRGLTELDDVLPSLIERLREEDIMLLTADHGNDPTTLSTDHSRELVPLLIIGPKVTPVALGDRTSFADIGATVAEYFGVRQNTGRSMLEECAPWAIG